LANAEIEASTIGLSDREQLLDDVALDGDEEHLQPSIRAGSKDLVIPGTFGQREGNVLLGLVLDDLSDLGGVDRGQFDELRENLVPGRGDVRLSGDESPLSHQFAQGLLENSVSSGILGTGKAQGTYREPEELQTAAFGRFKLGDLQASCPEVDPQKRLRFKHVTSRLFGVPKDQKIARHGVPSGERSRITTS